MYFWQGRKALPPLPPGFAYEGMSKESIIRGIFFHSSKSERRQLLVIREGRLKVSQATEDKKLDSASVAEEEEMMMIVAKSRPITCRHGASATGDWLTTTTGATVDSSGTGTSGAASTT